MSLPAQKQEDLLQDLCLGDLDITFNVSVTANNTNLVTCMLADVNTTNDMLMLLRINFQIAVRDEMTDMVELLIKEYNKKYFLEGELSTMVSFRSSLITVARKGNLNMIALIMDLPATIYTVLLADIHDAIFNSSDSMVLRALSSHHSSAKSFAMCRAIEIGDLTLVKELIGSGELVTYDILLSAVSDCPNPAIVGELLHHCAPDPIIVNAALNAQTNFEIVWADKRSQPNKELLCSAQLELLSIVLNSNRTPYDVLVEAIVSVRRTLRVFGITSDNGRITRRLEMLNSALITLQSSS
jgi:hypothetical protein